MARHGTTGLAKMNLGLKGPLLNDSTGWNEVKTPLLRFLTQVV